MKVLIQNILGKGNRSCLIQYSKIQINVQDKFPLNLKAEIGPKIVGILASISFIKFI